MSKKLTIEIEYGATPGHSPEAVPLIQDVMRAHDYDIQTFKFIIGQESKIDVRIDGDLVFSKGKSARFPSPEEISRSIRARLADGVWNDLSHILIYNILRFWRAVMALTRRKGAGYRWRRS